jgi:hypothetical protein
MRFIKSYEKGNKKGALWGAGGVFWQTEYVSALQVLLKPTLTQG